MAALTPAELSFASRRLAATRPVLDVLASIVDHRDLWRLCRDELTGVDLRVDGWDIRARWFGVVIAATPKQGALRQAETIDWRVVAEHVRGGG